MNKIEFNTQIATTREQSKRLLELGLKPETADYHFEGRKNIYKEWKVSAIGGCIHYNEFPAWSLHRLIELCGIDRMPISFGKKGRVRIRVNYIHPTHDGRSGYNHYDSLIDCIEWLIQNNYFNKEYLK